MIKQRGIQILKSSEKKNKKILFGSSRKENEECSTTSEENSVESNSLPIYTEIEIEEITEDGFQNESRLKALAKRNKSLENELKTMGNALEKSEKMKLDLMNRCNVMETQISNYESSLKYNEYKEKYMTLHQEKAEIEANFMNQLSELSSLLNEREREFNEKLADKEDNIFFLQSKLTSLRMNGTKIENGTAKKKSADEKDIDNYQKMIETLRKSLEENFLKNTCLSQEIKSLQNSIKNLEGRASRVEQLEIELKESRNTLNSFRRANSLLSSLDVRDEEDLCQGLLNSSREEESFMNELQLLEEDMSADLLKLEKELDNVECINNIDQQSEM